MTARTLTRSPRIWTLNVKAAASMVPGASRLPLVAPSGEHLPGIELELPDVRVDPSHLEAYREVCRFRSQDRLPATYPHVLAFPLQLAILTDRRFPFPAIGLVHFANRVRQRRPLETGERLSFRVRATGLEPHPKGRKFELMGEARVGEELVWEEQSTILRRGQSESGGGEGEPDDRRWPTAETWRIERTVGRRYASVSGDHNPIHVNSLAARLAGFPSVIAPGMWTKARSLAALEDRLPDAYSVDVRFERPIALPARVAFGSRGEEPRREFAVHDQASGKAHLTGTVEAI